MPKFIILSSLFFSYDYQKTYENNYFVTIMIPIDQTDDILIVKSKSLSIIF